MSYEIKGKLVEVFDTVEVSDKFKKREFVIETSNENGGKVYTNLIKFQLTQTNVDKLDYHNVNSDINVKFNLKGRKWEKDGKVSYFNTLDAWYIEKAEGSQPTTSQQVQSPVEEDESDDLPF
jgi:hypothetical protein